MHYFQDNSGHVFQTDHPGYYTDRTQYKPVRAAEGKKLMRAEAADWLRALLPPGSRVKCILRNVSRSGMQRRIDLYVAKDGDLVYLSGHASAVLYLKLHDKGGIVVGGCGMDMGFHLVYSLSSLLYPEGFGCIGDRNGVRCLSNDHFNGDRDYTPHSKKHPHWHNDGGYALKHEWV